MFKTLNKWIKTSRPWQTILRFLLVLLTTCTSLIASFSIITFAPPALAANACVPNLFYGSGYNDQNLYTLDINTGATTLITALQFPTAAISRDSRDGRIYYASENSGGPYSAQIAYYNPSFPADSGVLSNQVSLTDTAIKMAQQASTGDIFIASGDNIITRLSISNTTNSITSITTINPNIPGGSGDIAFDPNNPNILYLTRQITPPPPPPVIVYTPIELYRIDVTSGTSTRIGQTTKSFLSGSLAFDPSGNLLFEGLEASGADSLYTLNTGNGQETVKVTIPIAPAPGAAIGFQGFTDFGTLPIISPSTASTSLAIQKTASANAILVGQPISYNIVVTNTGGCDAVGINLTDTIDTSITGTSWSSNFKLISDTTMAGTGKAIPPSGNSNNINTTFNLSVGSELVITVSGTLGAAPITPPSTATNLVNSATITPPTGVTLTGTPTSTVNTAVLPAQPDLAIVKTGPATYSRGGNITYTLKVSNVGTANATNPVIVNDPAPSGATFVSSSSNVGTCTSFPCTFPPTTFTIGAVVTITATFTTSYTSPLGLDNVATVSTSGEDSRLLANNTSSTRAVASGTSGGGGVVPPVTPVVDVAIEITAPPSVPPGSNFTVTLTGKNVGTTTADNVVISYDVPPGVTVVSIPAGCVYNASASTITCASIPSFGSGATTSYDFVFKAPDTPATLTGVARISTTSPESNTGNNSAAATTLVATGAPTPSLPPGIVIPPGGTTSPGVTPTPPPVIATGLQATNPPVNNRDGTETVTFTLTITNTGTQTLSNLQAILDLVKTFSGTQGFVVLSINSSDFLVNSSFNGTDLQNLLGSGNVLAPGASGKITFSVRVTPGFNLGPYTATAFVQGTDPNGVIVTSITTAQVQFTGLPNVRLVKRMTNASRNGVALTNINFNTFVDDPNDSNDNAPGWSALSPVGLSRISESGLLQSGDALEYTVYFLSDGTGVASNFLFCDPIPAGSTFLPDTYRTGQGISLRLNGTDTVQTNAADSDAGRFISILSPAPSPCASSNNPNGSVYVQIPVVSNRSPNNVGFVRFQVKID